MADYGCTAGNCARRQQSHANSVGENSFTIKISHSFAIKLSKYNRGFVLFLLYYIRLCFIRDFKTSFVVGPQVDLLFGRVVTEPIGSVLSDRAF